MSDASKILKIAEDVSENLRMLYASVQYLEELLMLPENIFSSFRQSK
jgi:hypothetical protein